MSKPEKYVYDRSDHEYAAPSHERTTPVEEIPPQFRKKAKLKSNVFQILDKRLCYNWEPGPNGGRFVECGSVASDAAADKL